VLFYCLGPIYHIRHRLHSVIFRNIFSEMFKEFHFRLLSLSIFSSTLRYSFVSVLKGVQLNAVMIFTAVSKGKVIPLQARCGPEGGYRYSSTLP
jgi:hypothetical protein